VRHTRGCVPEATWRTGYAPSAVVVVVAAAAAADAARRIRVGTEAGPVGGSERVERVSEIPRSVGVSVCLVVAFARRASLGARGFLERRWFRDGGTHLHESPGALSFQTLGEDAALASPALRAVPRKVTRASRFLKLANASAERALAPSRVACEARDGGDWGAATTTGRCGLKSARFVSLCLSRGLPTRLYGELQAPGRRRKNAGQSFCEPLLPERNAASHASNHSSPRDWPWEKSVKASARMSKQSKSGKKIPNGLANGDSFD